MSTVIAPANLGEVVPRRAALARPRGLSLPRAALLAV
jgi:hypothetical protein